MDAASCGPLRSDRFPPSAPPSRRRASQYAKNLCPRLPGGGTGCPNRTTSTGALHRTKAAVGGGGWRVTLRGHGRCRPVPSAQLPHDPYGGGRQEEPPRALLAGIRLRNTDLLARHGDSGYLVISKDTGVEAVAGLAADLERTLSRVEAFANGSAPKIGAATPNGGCLRRS